MKTLVTCLFALGFSLVAQANEKPNIVYVICDDLGYGDVQCLAPETSKIPTPHADRLAKEGMIFTDAPIKMLPRLTKKSVEYIDSRAGKDEPFFLYVPLSSPHSPIPLQDNSIISATIRGNKPISSKPIPKK